MTIMTSELIACNDRVRKSSSTLLDYFKTIEQEIVDGKHIIIQGKIVSLKMYKGSMGYVRTTHSNPIGQKSTGWSGKKHVGELGWNGRVQITYQGNSISGVGSSDIFRSISIHSHSGGYNGGGPENFYKLNYDCSVFAKDLPLIYEQYLKYIDESESLISMLYSKDKNDVNLLEGLLDNNEEIKQRTFGIVKVLQGWNMYGNKIDMLNLFKETIQPHIAVKNQTEDWGKNKNLGWMIKDEFFRYTNQDFDYL